MTKLEQKLIQLGYELDDWLSWSFTNVAYSKKYEHHKIVIYVYREDKVFYKGQRVLPLTYYNNQQDIDNLQQAFNQLQNDLKELKEYEQH